MAIERAIILLGLWLEHIFGYESLPAPLTRLRLGAEARLLGRLKKRGKLGFTRTVSEIPDGKILPEEFFTNYLNKNIPVVLKSAAIDWPCCKKWSLDYLNKGYGTTEVLLPDFLTEDRTREVEESTLGNVVQNIRNGGAKYLRFSSLAAHSKELSADLNLSWIGNFMPARSIGNIFYMFAGGAGSSTPLHSDQPCNLYVQITGRKKWTLISPKQSHLAYPQGTQSAYLGSSAQYKKQSEWPLLQYADKLEYLLEEGDVLYVPPHYWHFVENETETISVAFRFSSLKVSLKSSIWLCFVRLFASRPFIWQTEKLGAIDTNLIMALENKQRALVSRWVERANFPTKTVKHFDEQKP